MNKKIFLVLGFPLFCAEVVSEDDDYYYIEYPAALVGQQLVPLVEIVGTTDGPVSLNKRLVAMVGTPTDGFLTAYDDLCSKVRASKSGIVLADSIPPLQDKAAPSGKVTSLSDFLKKRS